MTETAGWCGEDLVSALDQERDGPWLAVFARLNRGEFPGGILLTAPARVEFWVQFFCQRAALENEIGRRARLVLPFIPRSPHFVGAFLKAEEIPGSEKLRLIHLLASENAAQRQEHLLFEGACRVVVDSMLVQKSGHYGWEDCGINDAPRLLFLLSRIMLPLFSARSGNNGRRRRPNRKMKHPRGRPGIVRIPLRGSVVKMSVRRQVMSKVRIQAWQIVPFLKFATPVVQEIVFSWVVDFPELLCRLGGYELPLEWQDRIRKELERLYQGGRRPEVIRALRDYRYQLRGLIAAWAQETLENWDESMRLRFAPSGGNESVG